MNRMVGPMRRLRRSSGRGAGREVGHIVKGEEGDQQEGGWFQLRMIESKRKKRVRESWRRKLETDRAKRGGN